jgi:hypothetical protein
MSIITMNLSTAIEYVIYAIEHDNAKNALPLLNQILDHCLMLETKYNNFTDMIKEIDGRELNE